MYVQFTSKCNAIFLIFESHIENFPVFKVGLVGGGGDEVIQ
jgi:hypothetical protein